MRLLSRVGSSDCCLWSLRFLTCFSSSALTAAESTLCLVEECPGLLMLHWILLRRRPMRLLVWLDSSLWIRYCSDCQKENGTHHHLEQLYLYYWIRIYCLFVHPKFSLALLWTPLTTDLSSYSFFLAGLGRSTTSSPCHRLSYRTILAQWSCLLPSSMESFQV